MRMSILENLPHKCSAYLKTCTQGSMGGGKDALSLVFSDRDCWRQPAGDSEQELALKKGIDITHKVYFVENPSLDNRHVLVFSDGTYDVTSRPFPDATLGLSIVWKVMVNHNSAKD
jgi:hypothetical protein